MALDLGIELQPLDVTELDREALAFLSQRLIAALPPGIAFTGRGLV